MKKKFILGLSLIAISIPSLVFANSDIGIWMKGEIIKSDVAPFIFENRTMVPIRVISENLGKEVIWNGEEQKVIIKDKKGNELSLVINEKFMEDISSDVNRKIELDAPAIIKNNRTFVPIRAIAEAFGEKVDWDNDKRIVVIGENYDSNKISDADQKKEDPKKVLDPLGLDYLYDKDMMGKSDEEKAKYEEKMRDMPSKVFKGHKNSEVEACLAWLSFAKAGEFYGPELNKDPLLNPSKDKLYINVTKRGKSMSGFDDYDKEEYYQRNIMGLSSGPSMAELEHFDYYLNFDGTFNYFKLPLHYHGDVPEMLEEVKDIISKPKKVEFIKADKKDIERVLKTIN